MLEKQERIDFTKVRPRTYSAQWRFIIDCPTSIQNKAHYYRHYMPKWSMFISQIMRNRLSRTEVRDILPEIRELLPLRSKLADLHPLLFCVNPKLARSLLDCSAVFDSAPHELKSHILVAFGILPEMLTDYLEQKDRHATKEVA